MAHRALTDVLLGTDPPVHAGDLIPEFFSNMRGQAEPVDFDRLVEIGSAEKVEEKPKPKPPVAKAKS